MTTVYVYVKNTMADWNTGMRISVQATQMNFLL